MPKVGDLLQVIRARVLAHLVRRGIIEPGPERVYAGVKCADTPTRTPPKAALPVLN